MPEPLQNLLKTMNSEAALKDLKPYSTLEDLPGLGELVTALFPADGIWYRARVLEVDSQEVEVTSNTHSSKNICLSLIKRKLNSGPNKDTAFL